MSCLNHPCTVRLLAWTKEPLQIVMELCLGDLRAFYQGKLDEIIGRPYTDQDGLMAIKTA